MHDICSVCESNGISFCLINDITVEICKACGSVFIVNINAVIKLAIPLAIDDNWYAASLGIAKVYEAIAKGHLTI
jgi:hypothetical protein